MAMEAQTSPSPPFPTAGLGPCELSCSQLHSTILHYQRWVFWSAFCNDKVHCGKPRVPATADGAVSKDQIKCFLQLHTVMWYRCLIQFWGLVKIGDKTYLTTCDQPFALQYSSRLEVKQLCEYRKCCLEYLIPVDDDDDGEITVDQVQLIIGPPGRVFRSGLPESTDDVRHYTSREYPQRHYAVDRVEEYWALPIYHPTRHLPIGVLEIASPYGFHIPRRRLLERLENLLRVVNLTTTCVRLAGVSSCQDGEIAKIEEVLDEVSKICELDDTETWTTSGEILSCHRGVDFIRKGQGVVGRAFSSKSACFCRDIRQLSITEYPLVPIARLCGYSACFAVCLQSSCSNNCIYVLEFFFPTNEKHYGDLRILLNSLMETLKERLRSSFKIASGQELGQKLSVEVIKLSSDDQFDSFEICNTTSSESTPRLVEVQGEAGMKQPDFSSPGNGDINSIDGQQNGIVGSPPRPEHVLGFVNTSYQESMAAQCNASNLAIVDAANNSMNGTDEQQNGIVESSPRQELVQNIENIAHGEPIMEIDVANPETDGASIEQSGNKVINMNMKKQKPSCTLKSELGITREVLEQNSSRKLEDAAKVLGVSRSTLKRICREHDIRRWPPRKVRKVNPTFVEQRVVQPSTENIEEHGEPDPTRLEDDSCSWEEILKLSTTRLEDDSSRLKKLEKFLGI